MDGGRGDIIEERGGYSYPLNHTRYSYETIFHILLLFFINFQSQSSRSCSGDENCRELRSFHALTSMESLDDFFNTLNVDLEADDQDRKSSGKPEDNIESHKRLDTFTDSILRDDVVAPNVVHFASSTNFERRNRKFTVVALVLVLSFSGLFRFTKNMVAFFPESATRVESKKEVGSFP